MPSERPTCLPVIEIWSLDTYACLFTHRGDTDYRAVAVTAAAIVAAGTQGIRVLAWPMPRPVRELRERARRDWQDPIPVVGTSGSIHSDAARNFAIGFYGGLGECASLMSAYMQGYAAIGLDGTRDTESPQLKVRVGIEPARFVLAADAG